MRPVDIARSKFPSLSRDVKVALDGTGALMFLGVVGSHGYGTANPSSDVDLRGVFMNSTSQFYGLSWDDEIEIPALGDCKLFSFQKFMRLAIKGNPNILELMYLPNDCIIRTSLGWSHILDHRSAFATKSVAKPYIGFVTSQLHRMTHFEPENITGSRKALIEKHGYDTKNVAHAIRLCRSGTEYLTTGCMNTRRSDADELVAIINGKFGIQEAQGYVRDHLQQLKTAEQNSNLQESPDLQLVDALT